MDRKELRPILIARFPRQRSMLLPVLHYVQEEFGFVPDWTLQIVSWHLRVPASEIYGTVTSYPELLLAEPGNKTVRICSGLSCWYSGGKELADEVYSTVSTHGSKSAVTVEMVSCGFLCAMGPAIQINGTWRTRLDAKAVLEEINGPQA